MTVYLTRALTGLDTSIAEFHNCFVFAIASKNTFETGAMALYVFSPSQSTDYLLSQLSMVLTNTLYRGSLPNYGFQSDVQDVGFFNGAYDLRQLGLATGGVHVRLRRRGRRERGPFTFITDLAQIFQAIMRWLQALQSGVAYGDIILAVEPSDIGNATSLSGWVTRFDNPPPWMLTQIQTGN